MKIRFYVRWILDSIFLITIVSVSNLMSQGTVAGSAEKLTEVAAADTVIADGAQEIETVLLEPAEKSPSNYKQTGAEAQVRTDMRSYLYWDAAYFNEISDLRGEVRKAEPRTSLLGGLILKTWPAENLMLKFTPEFRSSTQFPMRPGFSQTDPPRTSSSAWLDVGKAVWTLGDLEDPSWRISFGLQYYKYNPHTKVLGDYFIKSMIYPSILFTRPFNSNTKILGLKVEKITGFFEHNLMVHANYNLYPHGDINLAYSATAHFGNFEVGAGLNWVSAIPIKPSRTNPKGGEWFDVYDNTWKELPWQDSTVILDGNTIKTIWVKPVEVAPGVLFVDSNGFSYGDLIVVDPSSFNPRDSSRHILHNGKFAGLSQGVRRDEGGYQIVAFNPGSSLVGSDGKLYSQLGIKETQYSFSGQTISFRAAFNPMAGETSLGKDPFKIYTEAAVLGWKNYNGFYENRSERIPVMFGVNFPTLNFLDHLVFELEWFGSKYEPSWYRRFLGTVPQPGTDAIAPYSKPWLDSERQKKDDWKWAVSAKKVFPGFALAAQGGTDHTRSTYKDEKFHDLMTRPSQWYTSVRFIVRL